MADGVIVTDPLPLACTGVWRDINFRQALIGHLKVGDLSPPAESKDSRDYTCITVIQTLNGETAQEGYDGRARSLSLLFVARHMQASSRYRSGGSENKRGDRRAWRAREVHK